MKCCFYRASGLVFLCLCIVMHCTVNAVLILFLFLWYHVSGGVILPRDHPKHMLILLSICHLFIVLLTCLWTLNFRRILSVRSSVRQTRALWRNENNLLPKLLYNVHSSSLLTGTMVGGGVEDDPSTWNFGNFGLQKRRFSIDIRS